jgi:hypothetical protein
MSGKLPIGTGELAKNQRNEQFRKSLRKISELHASEETDELS